MDKEIIDKGESSLSIEISENKIGLCVSAEMEEGYAASWTNAWIYLDLREGEDRLAAKALIRELQEALKRHEWPPYSTCAACSWLVRERGVEACEKHAEKT